MEASEKRNDDTDAVLKKHMNMMKEQHKMMINQQATLRNHQASIHNIEVQVGQLTTLVSNKLSSQFPEKNAQVHIMMIETEEEAISEFLEALEVEPKPYKPKPKKTTLKNENAVELLDSRRELAMLTTWDQSEQKNSDFIPAYRSPLSFLSQAHLSPLEREHLELIQQIKGIPINTPFIDSLSKIPEYTKFLQDLIDTGQQLKKNSKVILSEQSSKVVLGEIPKKMGDNGHLTLPCEFGNNINIYAVADSRARINLMPYSFYQKLNIQKLKVTKMTIHMANRSVTQPWGIVEHILVKIGKFIFPIDFVVLDMKEDPDVPIILGRPLLIIVGALVDISESNLTLRVGDDKETFWIKDGFQGSDIQEEVFNINENNELEELEKLMEDEIKTIHQIKGTKTRASVLFSVEVITYTKPTSLMSEEKDDLSSDEDEVISKETIPVVKE
ncbi:uncharacterized protein LOC111894774 [Lactuca sativa]|uniref:uncharacterized protein LOC111894774 n=1 Tax=Lactuca sativa TaxID=4236 RepID=UPI000CD8BDD7|nr:uncharacterized protein LOC111894774 [Lactuca sativa]